MPQRFLRPGIRHSERWNAVSWPAQSLYIRLLTIVDDFGRYNGRVSVIWAECFAVWNELNPAKICDPQETAALLRELSDKELIDCYTVEGKQVVQITQWQERIRAGAKERWPRNPNPQRIPAVSCGFLPPSSPSPSSSPTATAPSADSLPVELPPRFPKTREEAINAVGAIAAPEDFIELTWHKAVSRGGRDAKGNIIASWPHHVATELAYYKDRQATPRANGSPQPDQPSIAEKEVRKALRNALKP